jgi:hypothetical protein
MGVLNLNSMINRYTYDEKEYSNRRQSNFLVTNITKKYFNNIHILTNFWANFTTNVLMCAFLIFEFENAIYCK